MSFAPLGLLFVNIICWCLEKKEAWPRSRFRTAADDVCDQKKIDCRMDTFNSLSRIFFFIKKRIQVATWPALHCVVECTSAFTFKDHLDVTGHRTNSIGGVASVEALLRHCQRGAKTAWLFVGVPEPHYMRRGVSVSVTDELLRVTVEHRDCLWKFCDVNGGPICWDNKGSREGRVYENAHSCTVRTCV